MKLKKMFGLIFIVIFLFTGCNKETRQNSKNEKKTTKLIQNHVKSKKSENAVSKSSPDNTSKCTYDTYYGKAKIAFINDVPHKFKDNIKRFYLDFYFITKEKIKNASHNAVISRPINFTLAGNQFLGAKFIKKYKLKPGVIFNKARLSFLNNDGSGCNSFIYEIEGLDKNDKVDLIKD